MVGGRGGGPEYTLGQTVQWLGWLARSLSDRDESMFLVETLAPGWLPYMAQRICVRLALPTIAAIASAVVTYAVIKSATGSVYLRLPIFMALLLLLSTAVVEPPLIVRAKFSFAMQTFGTFALVTGVIIIVALGALFALTGIVPISPFLIVSFVAFGIAAGVAAGPLAVAESVDISYPNQGVVMSLRSILVTTIWVLPVTIVVSALTQASLLSTVFSLSDASFWVIGGHLATGIPAVLWLAATHGLALAAINAHLFGAASSVRHYLVRFFLWRDGLAPCDYVRFLEFAKDRVLLHRVGGAYVFVHQLLQDHFGKLSVPAHRP